MKEDDLSRFSAIVREYHRQSQQQHASGPENTASHWNYRDACDTLENEIGAERMEAAREEYDMRFEQEAEKASYQAHNDPQY